jgi:hypothetical protein
MKDRQTRKISDRPKKTFQKRLFRFFLFSTIICTTLFILALILFRMFFPPDKIRELANSAVQKSINRNLLIGDVSINPFRGFEIFDVQLYKHPDSLYIKDDFPILSAHVQSAVLSYSFKDLLAKKIHIKHIVIDSPTIEIVIPNVQPDTTESKKSSGNPFVVLDTLALPNMPVSVDLDLLEINNAELLFQQGDSIDSQYIGLSNLSFNMKNINLPKGDLKELKNKIKGFVGLECLNANINFRQMKNAQQQLQLNSTLNLTIKTDILGMSVPNLQAHMILEETTINSADLDSIGPINLSYPIKLLFGLNVQTEDKSVSVQPFTLTVDNQQWIELQANVTALATSPLLDFQLINSKIKIAQLLEIVSPILPKGVLPEIYLHNKSAVLDITKLSLTGPLPINPDTTVAPMDLFAHAKIVDFGTTVNYGEMELSSLSFFANTKGQISVHGLESLEGSIDVSYDSLFLNINDSLNIYTGPLAVKANTELGEDMLPKNIKAHLNINNVLGTNVKGVFDFAGNSFSNLKGTGSISLENFETKNLLNAPILTTAQFSADMKINTLDSIKIKTIASTDSIILFQAEENLTFPPVLLFADLNAQTDTSFKNLTISNMAVKLNDVIEAKLTAQTTNAGKEFSFNLEEATIQHKYLFDWVPKQYRAPLDDMVLTGKTSLKAAGSGQLVNDILSYSINSNINSSVERLAYPPIFLTLGGLELDVNASINSSAGATANLEFKIDSTTIETIRPDPLLATTFLLEAHTPDFQSFSLDSGLIKIPTLLATAHIYGTADSLQTNPHLEAKVLVKQSSAGPLAITRDLKISGATSIEASVKMDTSMLATKSKIVTKNVSLFLPEETSVTNINATVLIDQNVDLQKGNLIGRTIPIFNTPSPSTVDWHVLSQHYYSTTPNISNVEISQVNAAGYRFENIKLAAFIGEGIMEVPTFSANVYGGNVDGRISFDLASGDATQMSYQLSSHFSGINSALLLPNQGTGGGKGIINANLNLFGKGVDPNSPIDLDGSFYITQIGPKVADNLLRSLDPEGADLGIKMTRWFINQGFKPKLFTFTIRNSYFYPSVEFNQPIYFPIRLSGGRIELNRMPANFFIQTALKNAKTKSAEN